MSRTNEIIEAFLDRKHYNSKEEVIEAALNLLLETQLQKEALITDDYSLIDSFIVDAQLSLEDTDV